MSNLLILSFIIYTNYSWTILYMPPLTTFYPARSGSRSPFGAGLSQSEWAHGPDLALLVMGMRNNNIIYITGKLYGYFRNTSDRKNLNLLFIGKSMLWTVNLSTKHLMMLKVLQFKVHNIWQQERNII